MESVESVSEEQETDLSQPQVEEGTGVGTGEAVIEPPRKEVRVYDLHGMISAIKEDEWSLAGDDGLISHMEGMNKRILQKIQETEADVEDLSSQSVILNCRLMNSFNKYLLLSNTQFFENRIYDDEEREEEEKLESTDNGSEESEEAIEEATVQKYAEAMKLGTVILNRREKELDALSEGKLASRGGPKYERKMPFIIGTEDFLNDDMIGLGDDDFDVKTEENRSPQGPYVEQGSGGFEGGTEAGESNSMFGGAVDSTQNLETEKGPNFMDMFGVSENAMANEEEEGGGLFDTAPSEKEVTESDTKAPTQDRSSGALLADSLQKEILGEEEDDIFGSSMSQGNEDKVESTLFVEESQDKPKSNAFDLDEGDLFGDEGGREKERGDSKGNALKSRIDAEIDPFSLFGDEEVSGTKSKTASKSSLDVNVDDLFGDDNKSAKKSDPLSSKVLSGNIFLEEEEAVPIEEIRPVTEEEEEKMEKLEDEGKSEDTSPVFQSSDEFVYGTVKRTGVNPLFAEAASLSSNKEQKSKKTAADPLLAAGDKETDNFDDIFGTKPKKEEKKKAASEETDIFGTTPKKAEKKSPFEDTDLFAGTLFDDSTEKQKTKKKEISFDDLFSDDIKEPTKPAKPAKPSNPPISAPPKKPEKTAKPSKPKGPEKPEKSSKPTKPAKPASFTSEDGFSPRKTQDTEKAWNKRGEDLTNIHSISEEVKLEHGASLAKARVGRGRRKIRTAPSKKTGAPSPAAKVAGQENMPKAVDTSIDSLFDDIKVNSRRQVTNKDKKRLIEDESERVIAEMKREEEEERRKRRERRKKKKEESKKHSKTKTKDHDPLFGDSSEKPAKKSNKAKKSGKSDKRSKKKKERSTKDVSSLLFDDAPSESKKKSSKPGDLAGSDKNEPIVQKKEPIQEKKSAVGDKQKDEVFDSLFEEKKPSKTKTTTPLDILFDKKDSYLPKPTTRKAKKPKAEEEHEEAAAKVPDEQKEKTMEKEEVEPATREKVVIVDALFGDDEEQAKKISISEDPGATKGSEKKETGSSKKKTLKKRDKQAATPFDDLFGEADEKSKGKVSSSRKPKGLKNLFDDSDEEEKPSRVAKKKNVEAKKEPFSSLFDDPIEDSPVKKEKKTMIDLFEDPLGAL